jgi:hypothetical protein
MGEKVKQAKKQEITCTKESHHCSNISQSAMCNVCGGMRGHYNREGGWFVGEEFALHKCIIKIKCMMDCNYVGRDLLGGCERERNAKWPSLTHKGIIT